MWTPNTEIVSGLSDVGTYSAPWIYERSGTLYLIAGNSTGSWNGWYWYAPHSTWYNSPGAISGLTNFGTYNKPCAFYIGSILYLIVGRSNGTYVGRYWNTSTWSASSSIISGLRDVGNYSAPCTFAIGATTFFIGGELDGVFNGAKWKGSYWDNDSAVVSGLGDKGSHTTPCAFELDGETYLTSGEWNTNFNCWKWNIGTSNWDDEDSMEDSLTGGDDNNTPCVFTMDGDTFLIAGGADGTFSGWKWETTTTSLYPMQII